jgi:hypothetical protein
VVDFGFNNIPNDDDKIYESLAHLPLMHPSIININLGGMLAVLCMYASLILEFTADNSISSGLVESLCNVNKGHSDHLIHGLCEKISLL